MAAGEFPAPAMDGPPPLGRTRLRLAKPVIAAIEGGAFGGGTALTAAIELARQIAALPQEGLRAARDTAIGQWGLTEARALLAEVRRGLAGAVPTMPS